MINQTVNMALKYIGFKDILVAHGVRSIASTILNMKGFILDVIEAVLTRVRSVYNNLNINAGLEHNNYPCDLKGVK